MNIFKLWNKEFEKGISPFQFCLGITMIIAGFIGIQSLILFSMFIFLFAYFEPTDLRFSLKQKRRRR